MTRIKTLSISVLAGLTATLAMSVEIAQAAKKAAELKPPTPWLAYAVAIVAVAGVCFAAFRKPKRARGE